MKIEISGLNASEQELFSVKYALVGAIELLIEALREDNGEKHVEMKYNNRVIYVSADSGEFLIDDSTLCMSCGEWERTGLITSYENNETLCESCERKYQESRELKAQINYSY